MRANLLEHEKYLIETSQQLLEGCKVTAHDGTVLYTPDGQGFYKALWTRDFAYMVENAGDLIPPEHIQACIRYILRGQREDGVIPDRVRPDGIPVYAAGSEENPPGAPNLDNPQFLVIAVDEYLRNLPDEKSQELFTEWANSLDRGMETIPLSANGLVNNNSYRPHSPYGFTDTVRKTGELFIESVLYWTACLRLSYWHQKAGNIRQTVEYLQKSIHIENNLNLLWDGNANAFLAATQDCRQVDIWGNLYALYAGFPMRKYHAQVMPFLVNNYTRYIWRGQVRHLLSGEHWHQLLTLVEADQYQNGAYWATASGWALWVIAQSNPERSEQLLSDLVNDFKQSGIFECVNQGYQKLQGYVVSAINPLGGLRRLLKNTSVF